ncbi:Ig-like domain-containing protein [Actinobacillus porcinus]|uniref:Ig-like domain-containing protein n=1 Tax=Actinobacillus porcinus TaxID=51048 RepID=UPI0023559373|nr:Ig-like domain-containing protein [Actinobacillus porcinus]
MSKVMLTIVKGNKTESIALQQGKTYIKKAEAAARYRIVDENGVLIDNVQVEQIGDNLVFSTPANEEPLLVLEEYNAYYSVEDLASVVENSVSMTGNVAASSLSAVQLTGISLGAVTAAVGATSLYQRNKDHNSPRAEQENTPSKPEEQPVEPENKPTEPENKPTEPENKPTEPEVIIDKDPNAAWVVTPKEKAAVEAEIEPEPEAKNNTKPQPEPLPTLPELTEPAADKAPVAAIAWTNYIGGDDGVISQSEANDIIRLSGSYDVKGTSTTPPIITVLADIPRFAQVDPVTKTWWVDINASALVAKGEGERELSASITAVHDTNKRLRDTAQAKLKYIVDTIAQEPEITFDKITGDNFLSFVEQKLEKTTISGSVKHAKDGDFVKLEIGQSVYYAEVKNGKFSKEVNTQNLIVHEKVTASIETQSISGSTAKGVAETYANVEETPLTIKMNPVTTDNILNIAESQQEITLSGSVTRADDGSVVELTIGEQTIRAQVLNGEFEAKVSGELLSKHNTIRAVVKNSENMTALEVFQYETALDKPTITLRPITGDNVINAEEAAKETTVIAGSVTGASDGDIVEVSCGCPYCAASNWKTVRTKVVNGSFKVEFATAVLTADNHKVIRAKVIGTDKAGNHGEAETSQAYTVAMTSDANLKDLAAVGENNVFNKAFIAKNSTITYQGTVWGHTVRREEDLVEKVEIKLNGKTFSTNLSRDGFALRKFSTTLKVTDFADADEMYVVATIRNKETGKTHEVAEKVSYRYDTEANIAVSVNQVNEGKTISTERLNKNTLISGTLTYDEQDIHAKDIQVKVSLNGKEYDATVEGKKWSLNLPVNESTLIEGNNPLKVNVIAKDIAGNSATAESAVDFQVDLTPPMPIITLNPINENNLIAKTATNSVVLSGKVSGDFTAGEVILLQYNGKAQSVKIQDDGSFSLTISAAELAASNTLMVSAVYTTKDAVGNTGTAQSHLSYSVSQGNIGILLNDITADNHINVTEAKGHLVLSGKIFGADASTGTQVLLQINGKTHQVQVEPDLSFKLAIAATELIQTPNYTISANASAGSSRADTSKNFTVATEVAAQIDITEVGDFSLSIAEKSPIVRIWGEVEFDGVYAQGKNYNEVRQAIVTIGNQSFKVGVNNKTFFVDIAAEDLKGLNGQQVSVKFTPDPKVYELTKADGFYKTAYINAPEVTTKSVIFTSDYVKVENKDQYFVAYHEDMAVVRGVVSGTATAGDIVTLNIGNQILKTTVEADLSFSATLSKQTLSRADKISATLETTDRAGKTIKVSDQESYTVAASMDGEKRIGLIPIANPIQDDHSKEGWTTPYFLKAVGNLNQNGYSAPLGGTQDKPYVIKYYFHGTEELEANKALPADALVDEGLKDVFRNAYAILSSYTNIQFVESKISGDRDTFVHYSPMSNGSAAVARNGGHITWNAGSSWKGWGTDYLYYTALHEIEHTLGMVHTDAGDIPTFKENGYGNENTAEFSIISYNRYVNDNLYLSLRDLRPYDLAYLHYRFGVNPNARAGDDVYSFANYNTYASDGGRYIWDGNGVDTFDASKEKQNVYVNLNPGSWSYVGDVQERNFLVKNIHSNTQDVHQYFDLPENTTVDSGNGQVNSPLNIADVEYTSGQVYIGQGTQIENLIGSEFNDTLIGNAADNNIFGGAGNDHIEGGAGNDYLDGGLGEDKMIGSLGDDTYLVDNAKDVITEAKNEGTDSVYSTVNYRLSENVENLTLIGNTAKEAYGNDLDNVLTANNIGNTLSGGAGNDRLIGGLGADTLIGGAGSDHFVFNTTLNGNVDIIKDFSAEDKIELSKTVFQALSDAESIARHIKYDNTNGQLSYDAEANGDLIHFATLENHLSTLDHNNIVIV